MSRDSKNFIDSIKRMSQQIDHTYEAKSKEWWEDFYCTEGFVDEPDAASDHVMAELENALRSRYSRMSGLHALDIACGTGKLSYTLASYGFKVTGIDWSCVALSIFASKYADPNIAVIEKDIRRFRSLADQEYDLICIKDFLSNFVSTSPKEDSVALLERILQCLSSNSQGRLCVIETKCNILRLDRILKEVGFTVDEVISLSDQIGLLITAPYSPETEDTKSNEVEQALIKRYSEQGFSRFDIVSSIEQLCTRESMSLTYIESHSDCLDEELRQFSSNSKEAKMFSGITVAEAEEDDMCKVCFDARIDSCIFPCKHCSICYECAVELMVTSSLCPMCREPIGRVIRIFRVPMEASNRIFPKKCSV